MSTDPMQPNTTPRDFVIAGQIDIPGTESVPLNYVVNAAGALEAISATAQALTGQLPVGLDQAGITTLTARYVGQRLEPQPPPPV